LRLELAIVECIRLELVRYAWSTAKLNVASIDTLKIYDDALANGQLAPHVTDYECKQALVMRIFIELEGKFMMNDTLKRLKRERTLVLSERLREENSLPTDLWKRQTFTENFSIIRPHIVDDLIHLLSQKEFKQDDNEPSTVHSNDMSTTDEQRGR
jgi:hypothetical protein